MEPPSTHSVTATFPDDRTSLLNRVTVPSLIACWLCSLNGVATTSGARTLFTGTLIRTSSRLNGTKSLLQPSGRALLIQRDGMKRRRWVCSHHCTQSIATRWLASCPISVNMYLAVAHFTSLSSVGFSFERAQRQAKDFKS